MSNIEGARMKTEHAFALIALILGVVGGVLLGKGIIDITSRLIEGTGAVKVEGFLIPILGIAAIVASAMIWTGRYLVGGVMNMIFGLIAVVYGADAEGLMVLLSGLLGIVAPKIKE
jgi:hypothetical protein